MMRLICAELPTIHLYGLVWLFCLLKLMLMLWILRKKRIRILTFSTKYFTYSTLRCYLIIKLMAYSLVVYFRRYHRKLNKERVCLN